MGFLITFAVIIALGWVTVRSMNRERAARDRAAAIKTRVRQSHTIHDLYVSRDDYSLVGLSAARDRLVIGKGEEDRAVAMADVLAIEGLRDELVLIRADRTSGVVPPERPRTEADLPDRIRSLSLRITLADGSAPVVLFFDGGKHGVPPANEAFRKAAARTEDWFRRLGVAMRATQD